MTASQALSILNHWLHPRQDDPKLPVSDAQEPRARATHPKSIRLCRNQVGSGTILHQQQKLAEQVNEQLNLSEELQPLFDQTLDKTIAPSPILPVPLSTRWIRKNIGDYLDRAIDEPTKEHVSQYLYLDRLVKEKAERFARVGKQVIESDPMLDENYLD
ncbi:conjugal transfer protein TraF [Endozoicomonas euniceicola]|uniref:Conjugal transfer protein TraF n=1 Tax=Endozoicomonas euniceicola TaxID=1234143 RepID=A0ABY6GUB3_9GAMM|nr:conjugal transfer protein TraF [Endozoicomonas euniceicola]UYM16368.1 conjugal transfer protein TraF [Endozoicomonas euniceicola]